MTAEQLNRISRDIVDVAYHLHKELGPGLRESVYEQLFATELRDRGHKIERQRQMSANFGGVTFHNAFRPDIVVEDSIIIEIKAQRSFNNPIFARQVVTYLKAADLRLGFVINFGRGTIKEGITRVVNRL